MRKTISLILLIILMITCSYAYAESEDNETNIPYEVIDKQLDSLNIKEVTNIIKEINYDTGEYFGDLEFNSLIEKIIKGEKIFEEDRILNGILKLVLNELMENMSLIIQILLLSIISAILMNLQKAFDNKAVSNTAQFITYIILISIVIKSFVLSMEIGKSTIDNMVVFMQALLPVLFVLLMAVGGLASSSLLHPLILGSLGLFSTLIKEIIIPLIFFSTILGLVSNISDRIQVDRVSGLLREISVVVLGASFTIFMGIMSIQGISTAQIDGITIRTAKFAVDNLIPVVGGFLSDAMDTVVGCSLLLKNSVGVIGVMTLFLIVIIPAIKLISIIFAYRITAAIIEPISDERIVKGLNNVSKALIILLGLLLTVTLMFIIAITIIVGAGNVSLMMR
ncbi:stage III sporulation protein AE [Clostridium sp. D2Q-14]|uniref:stage III sporulation protein AE n=1 Tax=Anaeromonas gelatinilytica TaxID=2683194 RepID=UPI00193B0BE0|nr:stage III sporulation protein AE [Anaeromonas gelatinilytica]MBS4536202.1 stage III sporulation protein AE [Anaeromonas gelatinilytica]